jgi:hypothetical protein
MLQRPQTLVLLLIIILMVASAFLPNWEKTSQDASVTAIQTAFELKTTTIAQPENKVDVRSRYHIAGILLLVVGLAGFSISQFKNRMAQLKIGFGITLSITLALVFIMLGAKEGEQFLEVKQIGKYGYGFYCLFIALFANIVSNRLIRRDEQLVRSMDRIR